MNTAARWYREFLPPEEFHDPEMTRAEFEAEARRMTWYGVFVEGALVGVMGLEYVRDAALLRHASLLPAPQRGGGGGDCPRGPPAPGAAARAPSARRRAPPAGR